MSETKHMEYMMKDILKRLTDLNDKCVSVERKFDNAVYDFVEEKGHLKDCYENMDSWALQLENHIDDDHFWLNDEIKKLQNDFETVIQLKYKCEDLESLCGKLNQRIEELERRCGGSCDD